MEIYIEYAFLENFLYDLALLWLAFTAARVKTRGWKLFVSSAIGGVFAVAFPLLSLPQMLGTTVKMAMGALLCMLAFGQLRTKKQWGKYALITALFFAFSFGFGGTLLVVYGPLSIGEKVPSGLVFLGFALLLAVGIYLVKKLYARRAVYSRIYTCTLFAGERQTEAEGFYDSGNLAMKNGVPVCFVSPALLYDLFGEEILKTEGQVFDEMQISTLAGEKTTRLYLGEIAVKADKKTVYAHAYFAPSKNMIGREYTVLLNARIVEEREDAAD